jgi:CxxC motif-containing protein
LRKNQIKKGDTQLNIEEKIREIKEQLKKLGVITSIRDGEIIYKHDYNENINKSYKKTA